MDTSIVKLQVKALAAEAQMSRKTERKALRNGRFFNERAKYGELPSDEEERKLIVEKIDNDNASPVRSKTKVGEEITEEMDLNASVLAYEKYWNIHYYRVNSLRKLARATQLAYAFMRGIPYSKTEAWKHTVPSWESVEEVIWRLAPVEVDHEEYDPRVIKQRLEAWIQEAKGVA